MGEYLIVVVNDEKARLFTLEPVKFPEFESGPRIVELEDLINPDAMVGDQERYSDSKTGRGTAPQGGPVHGYDDRREQHLGELRRRFSVMVMKEVQKLAKAQRVGTIIVVTAASMRPIAAAIVGSFATNPAIDSPIEPSFSAILRSDRYCQRVSDRYHLRP